MHQRAMKPVPPVTNTVSVTNPPEVVETTSPFRPYLNRWSHRHLFRGAWRLDPDGQRSFEITKVAGGEHDADATLDPGEQCGRDPVRVEPGGDLVLGLHVSHTGRDLVVP